MAQRLSEQVVEWLTVGGNAFTPQNFNSTNGNVTLAVSAPGETISIPATSGGPIGIYNNKGQLWTLGASNATANVRTGQVIISSSDTGSGGSVALELWRGTAASWQLLDNGGIFYISNNYTDSAQTSYTNNLSMRYGAVADQYTHLHSTKDSSYAYSAGGAALSVAGGATFAKKVYINDTTDSNYSTVAGSLVTMGGAYIKKKTYIADTTDASSTSTGSFSTAGGASVAKKLYVGSDFTQTGDTALIQSNVIRLRNKSANNNQAGTYPYITSLSIGDSTEITLDEYKDGYLSIHSKSGILLYPQTNQPAVYDATKTYSVGTIVWYNKEYYRCTTAITEAQQWTAANWTKLPIASGTTWSHGNFYPTITNNYTLGSSSYRWKSLEIGTASSYGSGTQPIYWNAGVPTASTSTVGSGTKPIYLSSGTITVSSSTAGGTAQPIYLSSGELKAISATVGSGVKPIYLSSGTLTVSSSTVGSGVKPVYLSSGEITVSSSTVGSGVKPIYLSSGTLTVSSSSLGGTAKPIYMTSGELKAISDTVGTATKPVYLSSGTITVGTYELKATVNYEVNAKINSGTANQVAYYSGANAISSKAPAWSAWTAGTTAGPKANIQIGNATYTSDAIPSASASASGIVTTGNQTFAGRKTMDLISPSIYDGTSTTSRYKHLYYKNNAGTMVGEIEYDSGNATNVSSGKFYFTEMSPKSTADTATTGYYETYALPTVTTGRTANATYEIITTKNPGSLYWANVAVSTSSSTTTTPTFGATTISGTLTLSKTQDASGSANNSPALIIGGAATAQHIEIDGNEILSKSNGTTPSTLYLQDGGTISLAGVLQSNTTNYGGSLPTSGLSTGRIFFKTV